MVGLSPLRLRMQPPAHVAGEHLDTDGALGTELPPLLINECVMATRGQWLHVERWVCPSDHPTSWHFCP